MTKKEIAEILKKCRIDAGLTQKEAAQRIGRPQQTLASWETGQSQPDANTLFALCDLYGVSVDDAFGYSAGPRPCIAGRPISDDEEEFIKMFRALDARGQAAVLDALHGQLRFCSAPSVAEVEAPAPARPVPCRR